MVKLLGTINWQFLKLLIRDVRGMLFDFFPDRLMCRGGLDLACRWLLCLGLLLLQPLDEQGRGLGHGVVERGIAAAVVSREDGAFQVFR